MSRDRSTTSVAGIATILGIGWILTALHIAQAIDAHGNFLTVLIGIAIPLALSLTLFISAIGVYLHDLGKWALRISAWTIAGLLVATGLIGLFIVYLGSVNVTVPNVRVLIVNVAASGSVLGFLIGLYDAQRVTLTEELKTEHDRARGLYQRVSVLNRILRHDIRNQMNIIAGHADQLKTGDVDPTKAATRIYSAGMNLADLSESVREYEELLTNPDPDVESLDLADIVHSAIDSLADEHPEVRVNTELPESVEVIASPLLRNAIDELLRNAIEHNDADEPEIRVAVTPIDENGPADIELTIADNGPGLPPAETAALTAPGETDVRHSDGIGLWIVQWIVDASNGELSFANGQSAGTTVTIRLHQTDEPDHAQSPGSILKSTPQ